MTTANKITVIRILMIPVFVTLAIYYGQSIQEGNPQDWQRFADLKKAQPQSGGMATGRVR